MSLFLWNDIAEHFEWNWDWYVIIISIISVFIGFMYLPNEWFETEPATITITQEAQGKIVSIRATGSWENWCKVELKFEDGTVLLASYAFIREYNIKEGRSYSICQNSYYGRTAMELEKLIKDAE